MKTKTRIKAKISYIIILFLCSNMALTSLSQVHAQRSSKTVQSVNNFNNKNIQIIKDASQKNSTIKNLHPDNSTGDVQNVDTHAQDTSLDGSYEAVDSNQAEKQLKLMSDQFDSIVDEFGKIEQRKKDMETKYTDLIQSLRQIVADVSQEKKMISERISKIRLYNDKLNQLKSSLDTLKVDIDNTKADLSKYTNALYRINNDFYGKDLKIDDIKLLVKSDNVSRSLSNEEIIKALSLKLDDLMGMLQNSEQKYQDYTDRLMDIKSKYKTEAIEYKKDLDSLNQQKQYIGQMVMLIKDNRDDLDDRYNTLIDDRKNIREQIVSIINVTQSAGFNFKDKGVIGQNMAKLLASNDDSELTGDKFFTWPLTSFKRVSTFFDDKDYLKEFGAVHKAIDIAVPQGTEVYAPADGIVYKVSNNDSSSSVNRLMMFHKKSYVTNYLHMNQIFVKEGDYVKKGQIIGLSGGKPGTRGAGMLTTGPHLHFEVIKGTQYIDPLTILDLSIFNTTSQLPQKYHLKYLKDKFSRNINLTDIDYMDGDTVRERRQNFLNKYAASAYKDAEIRESSADEKNIDVDLGICVGFAETGLGKHMASTNNIGNVGNNDRGDRKGFSDPSIGVKSIYYALGNKLLGSHYTLDQLSRFGNKTGTIYASSDFNWEKNIVRCMTTIKGYRVAEDYPFRISGN